MFPQWRFQDLLHRDHDLPSTGIAYDVNPMQTDGFEFVEYAQPENSPVDLAELFVKFGFQAVQKHKTKNIVLYRQGKINFLINYEPSGFAADFAKEHGPCACAMAFRVKDAAHALKRAGDLGAQIIHNPQNQNELDLPAIEGIGGSLLFFVDKYGARNIYEDLFETLPGVTDLYPKGVGLTSIDHLTHNVIYGHMDDWAKFYVGFFNFHQQHFFDIMGTKTGLISRAMVSPCGKIKIPINESSDDRSQIVEFINDYKGEGIQHIALSTGDIDTAIDILRSNGISFMDVPKAYYEVINERLAGHGLDLEKHAKNNILIDGEIFPDGRRELLLQIFTNAIVGPIFFEIIQRRGHEGFGEGNFTALFESIERDQIRRGVLS